MIGESFNVADVRIDAQVRGIGEHLRPSASALIQHHHAVASRGERLQIVAAIVDA